MPGSSAIKAGEAFVSLFTDKSRMVSGLKSAEKDFKNWGGKITSIGAGLSVASAAVTAPMFLATTAFAAAGSELNDMSARTGASVESLSLLKFAAEQTGADFAAVGVGVKGLDNKLADAVGGNKAAQDSFARLGLSAGKLATMSVEDQFAAIADGLQNISNPALRASAAQDIFGKSGMALLPMLKDGSSGLKKLTDRGKEVGAMWTGDMATSADDLGDRIDELKTTGMSLAFAVGGALAPALMELSEPIFAIATGTREWIAANPGVITTVATIAAGVGTAGVAITGLGLTVSAIGMGLGALVPIGTAIGFTFTAMVSPIGLTVIALTALGGAVVWATGGFERLEETFNATWQGINDAIGAGDLALAGNIAIAGLNVVWQAGLVKMETSWNDMIAAIARTPNFLSMGMVGPSKKEVNTERDARNTKAQQDVLDAEKELAALTAKAADAKANKKPNDRKKSGGGSPEGGASGPAFKAGEVTSSGLVASMNRAVGTPMDNLTTSLVDLRKTIEDKKSDEKQLPKVPLLGELGVGGQAQHEQFMRAKNRREGDMGPEAQAQQLAQDKLLADQKAKREREATARRLGDFGPAEQAKQIAEDERIKRANELEQNNVRVPDEWHRNNVRRIGEESRAAQENQFGGGRRTSVRKGRTRTNAGFEDSALGVRGTVGEEQTAAIDRAIAEKEAQRTGALGTADAMRGMAEDVGKQLESNQLIKSPQQRFQDLSLPNSDLFLPETTSSESTSASDNPLLSRMVEVLESLDQRVAAGSSMTA